MVYAQYGNYQRPQTQANYAYSQYSVVDEMAGHHRVIYNPHAVAGMPEDTFRQSRVLTSSRQFEGPSRGKVMAKEFGSFFKDISTILSVVGLFAPPIAAVAAIAGPVSSMVHTATSQIDTRPQAVQVATVGRYNYWFR